MTKPVRVYVSQGRSCGILTILDLDGTELLAAEYDGTAVPDASAVFQKTLSGGAISSGGGTIGGQVTFSGGAVVQDTALNGAQVASLLSIGSDVAQRSHVSRISSIAASYLPTRCRPVPCIFNH